MTPLFRLATEKDASVIAEMVVALTEEICARTDVSHFDLDVNKTQRHCEQFLKEGHYSAVLGFEADTPVAVATFTETYALYAEGKMGVIQEFYVKPERRSDGLGNLLIDRVKDHGRQCGWACLELCTPPLPQFERTLSFYQQNGMIPVGGRKMRETL